MPTPSLGRVVLYKVRPYEVATNNDGPVAAAIVTRVSGDGATVNLKVLTDAAEDLWVTSVPFAGDDVSVEDAPTFSWIWPPRV